MLDLFTQERTYTQIDLLLLYDQQTEAYARWFG
jgi:hypothetical protein